MECESVFQLFQQFQWFQRFNSAGRIWSIRR